jgi:hypothetical protein
VASHAVVRPTAKLPNAPCLDLAQRLRFEASRRRSDIDPPFLIDGLKSDIRIYVLVTSFHPLTCYLYDDGLARFATELYGTSDLDRRCMHLTNYSLNKHSRNFVMNTNETQVSPSRTLYLSHSLTPLPPESPYPLPPTPYPPTPNPPTPLPPCPFPRPRPPQDGEGSKWSLLAFKRRLREELGEVRVPFASFALRASEHVGVVASALGGRRARPACGGRWMTSS